VVIVAGRRAEQKPDRNRLTIQILLRKRIGGKEDPGEIVLIHGDMPQMVVKAPEAVMIETEYPQGGGRVGNKQEQKRMEKRKGEVRPRPFFLQAGLKSIT